MFDNSNTSNPYKDWNMVYIPYTTGDVYFGTKHDATVPVNVQPALGPQQFVGYENMKLYVGRIVPTFKDKVDHVIVTGASAGGFGAALNASMISDAFGDVLVDVVDDSGPPFEDQYMPVCMQKKWREGWGFSGSMPPDCTECQQADGGGMLGMADFLIRKHPRARIALISTTEDEVIRLFYSVGLQNCANFDTADPIGIFTLQGDPNSYYDGPATTVHNYADGLNALRTKYGGTGRFATYYMGGTAPANTYHQHVFRARFYDKGGTNPSSGVESIADFIGKFINGTVENVGP
jgi:hypothetical protein